jgi:serine/threonine-protein kinase/endoribonuclease IRE1
MHYVLTAGGHPYGNAFERDANIMRGTPDLSSLSACREAVNLISAMLSKQPGARPTMAGVLQHPFWWGVEQRLNFLVDVSDRVEFEDREPDASLLNALEAVRSAAVGATNWGAALDAALVANLGRYRRYDYTSLRDLLRVVRNKRNHFREMPEPLQRAMGPVPDGYLRYFASRFPDLLMAVWAFAVTHLGNDEHLVKYWPDGVECLLPFCRRFQLSSARTHNKGSVLAHHPPQPRSSTPKRLSVSSSSKPPVPPSPPNVTAVAPARMVSPLSRTVGAPSIAPPPLNLPGAESPSNGVGSKQQQQQQSYASALATTRAAEPQEPSAGGVRSPEAPPAVVVGYEVVGGEEPLHYPPFPRRPGQQPCEFYSKTGTCRFGQECCFDHPEEHAVPLTEMNLPYRDGEPVCAFYMKTHQCKFGASCKFHHPRLRPILAGSASSGGN